jgi:hypothetical protein
MTVSEPTTLLTNAILCAAAAGLGWRLLSEGRAPSRRATRLWGWAFLAGAAAAGAGGTVHGFAASLAPAAHAALWKTVLASCGLCCALLVAGSAVAVFAGRRRCAALAAVAFVLAAYLLLAARSDDIRLAAALGAAAIASLLALSLVSRSAARAPLALAAALALSAAGLAVQLLRLPGPGPFNHNDLCHLLQAAALWPFYRLGRRLRDARRA